MVRCAIIDDEPRARECIVNYVNDISFLRLVGTGSNPVELQRLMDAEKIDLIFLDIETPVMNGIEFLKMISNPPMVVFTTAYPSYAVEGFQLDVLDYLVKPITFSRFFKAATKAKDYQQLLQNSQSAPADKKNEADFFFIKCDYKFEKIFYNEILFIQALQNYITIHTTKGKYVTLLSMKSIEEKLSPSMFIRVHKSFIVSIPRIEAIENNDIVIQSFKIPISRTHQPEVIDRVITDKLWKK
jgi:DNA-binding LytR/AlgR family response regulator